MINTFKRIENLNRTAGCSGRTSYLKTLQNQADLEPRSIQDPAPYVTGACVDSRKFTRVKK